MKFSHRDHRVDARIERSFWLMLALAGTLGVVAFLAPWPVVDLVALLGLAALGGVYVLRSERKVSEYMGDLRSVRGGGDVSGLLRVEVSNEVGRERPVGLPTRRSPNARSPPGPGKARSPVSGSRP
ncbi:MAG: hypothetical protein WB852_03715 [Thermoplasmata archaeon]|jgi:hypothetical protein